MTKQFVDLPMHFKQLIIHCDRLCEGQSTRRNLAAFGLFQIDYKLETLINVLFIKRFILIPSRLLALPY